MTDILAKGMRFLESHQLWAGPLLGALAAFESLAVIGAFAPLTASLLLVGAALGAGVFQPAVLVWIMVGCAVGNGLSYEAGALARRRGLQATWLPARARAAAEGLFRRHGASAVFIARFMGPPASVAPFLAGWTALERRRFWIANGATCVVWPAIIAAVGVFGIKSLFGWSLPK
jgi:membrane protein DedA with SNARE-associated domain